MEHEQPEKRLPVIENHQRKMRRKSRLMQHSDRAAREPRPRQRARGRGTTLRAAGASPTLAPRTTARGIS